MDENALNRLTKEEYSQLLGENSTAAQAGIRATAPGYLIGDGAAVATWWNRTLTNPIFAARWAATDLQSVASPYERAYAASYGELAYNLDQDT